MTARAFSDDCDSPVRPRRVSIVVICEVYQARLAAYSEDLAAEAGSIKGVFGDAAEISAVVFGRVPGVCSTLGLRGVAKIFFCPMESPFPDPDLAASVLGQLVRDMGPCIVLAAQSPWADDLCPTLAVELGWPLVSNCVGIRGGLGYGLAALQSVQGGRLYQERLIPAGDRLILSLLPEALGHAAPGEEVDAVVEEIPLPAPRLWPQIKERRIVQVDPETIPLEEADRVIALGRGTAAWHVPLLEELAKRVRGSLGATRPVVDAGLLPFERQIGQTGKLVSPALLFTWGVSGANEFTIGIEKAHTVVSVNTDPQARIFGYSDLGLVGDAGEVLDKLLSLIALSDEDIQKDSQADK
jgi:electron transfer flavoprotein alpha subunit